MKVLLVNGSGHAKGCTYTALEEVAGCVGEERYRDRDHSGRRRAIAGCIGCGACLKTGNASVRTASMIRRKSEDRRWIRVRISRALCIGIRYDHFFLRSGFLW